MSAEAGVGAQAAGGSRRRSWRRLAVEWGTLVAGAFATALALDWFLVPNRIAAGGVSGLATVLYHVFGLPVGITMFAINVPLFLLSLRVLGTQFGLKTVVGTVLTSAFVDGLAPYLRPLTENPFLASLYGGALAGLGIGLTFRAGGSTGGTDMAAQVLHRFLRLSPGKALLAADALVILLAGLVFSPELALWAFLSVFVTTKAIDLVQEGRAYAKGAFIIARDPQQVGQAVLRELDRGATALKGRGMYTGLERDVLFVVVAPWELQRLREIVHRIDPQAFMVITDVFDVLGEGFRRPEER